jgi:hypothetical protein
MPPKSKVELFAAIRRDARVEKLSVRALARRHGVYRRLVREALTSAWPAPRKPLPTRVSVLGPYKAVVDQIVRDDLDAPVKQRHGLEHCDYGHYAALRTRLTDYAENLAAAIDAGEAPPPLPTA